MALPAKCPIKKHEKPSPTPQLTKTNKQTKTDPVVRVWKSPVLGR